MLAFARNVSNSDAGFPILRGAIAATPSSRVTESSNRTYAVEVPGT